MNHADDWPLLLRSSFGNIFKNGRWDFFALTLVAEAINTGGDDEWADVKEWANEMPWNDADAC